MKGEDRAQQPGPRSDFNRAPIVPRDPLVVRATEYADWGDRCLNALGTYLWPLHIEHCAECRAAQERWDAEAREKDPA